MIWGHSGVVLGPSEVNGVFSGHSGGCSWTCLSGHLRRPGFSQLTKSAERKLRQPIPALSCPSFLQFCLPEYNSC